MLQILQYNTIIKCIYLRKIKILCSIDFQNAISTFKIPNGRGQTIKCKNFKVIDDANIDVQFSINDLASERVDFLKQKGKKEFWFIWRIC